MLLATCAKNIVEYLNRSSKMASTLARKGEINNVNMLVF